MKAIEARNAEIIANYKNGITLARVGSMFSLTGERVRRILKQAGVDRKKPRKVRPATGDAVLKQKARFWARVDITTDPDECWEWTGRRHPLGYGQVAFGKKVIATHRLAWMLANGGDTALWILHSCDNPPCCNPNHLREGTAKDNAKDRMDRGRSPATRKGSPRTSKGWISPLRRLSDEQVRQAFRRIQKGEPSAQVALSLGTTKTCVNNSINRLGLRASTK